MRRIAGLVLRCAALISIAPAVGGLAQQLTDDMVNAAIYAGQNKKTKDLVADCSAGAGFGANFAAGMAGGIQYTGTYTVVTSSNVGRIAFIAQEAKRLYKAFSIDLVPLELRSPLIVVSVEPDKPTSTGNVFNVPAVIEAVVLKSKTIPPRVLQPKAFNTEPLQWTNLVGGKVDGNRAVVSFDFAEFRELPAGDVEVVIVTPAGERRCGVSQNDRKKLLTAQIR